MGKAIIRYQKISLRIFLCLALITGYEFLVTGCVSSAQDKIAAIVNKDIITQKDLSDFINFMRIQLSTEYKGEQLEKKIQSMKSDLRERLIEDKLILQEAKKNKVEIDKSRIKAKVDEIRKRYSSDNEFQGTLLKEGLTQADLESRITEQLLMRVIIEVKIRSKILVNPSEVTEFYNSHPREFMIPEKREFEYVYTDNRRVIDDIYRDLKASAGLVDLTARYSVTVNRMDVYQGQELRKDIEDTVFKLRISQITEPLKIDDKYYVFRLYKITPSKRQSLSDVQDGIYAFLLESRMQERLSKWVDELKSRSYIKVMPN